MAAEPPLIPIYKTTGWLQFLSPYDLGRLQTVCAKFSENWRDTYHRQAAAAMVPILEDEISHQKQALGKLEERKRVLLSVTKRLQRRMEKWRQECEEQVAQIRIFKEQIAAQAAHIRVLEVSLAWETRLRRYLTSQIEAGRPILPDGVQILMRQDPEWIAQEARLRICAGWLDPGRR